MKRAPISPTEKVRAVANLANLSTPLGLLVALAGRAVLRHGPRGLVFAEGYRPGFPRAGAFTVGNVVICPSSLDDLERHRRGTIEHEDLHAWQWSALAGLPFLPAYLIAVGWSWLRTGDVASGNVFERAAGLTTGGYRDLPVDWSGWRRLRGLLSREG